MGSRPRVSAGRLLWGGGQGRGAREGDGGEGRGQGGSAPEEVSAFKAGRRPSDTSSWVSAFEAEPRKRQAILGGGGTASTAA